MSAKRKDLAVSEADLQALAAELASLDNQCSVVARRWCDLSARLEQAQRRSRERLDARAKAMENNKALEAQIEDLKSKVREAKDMKSFKRQLIPLNTRLAVLEEELEQHKVEQKGRPHRATDDGIMFD